MKIKKRGRLPKLMHAGKRICIIGRSCSGKSTLANNLSRAFGLPLLHLDQIAFIPHTNWQRCVVGYLKPQSRIGAMKGATRDFNWDMVRFTWWQYPVNLRKYYGFIAQYAADKPVLIIKNFRQMQTLYNRLGLVK